MKRVLVGLLCLAALGCTARHTWKINSTGDRTIAVKLDLSGLRAVPVPVPGG
ncbi:hypothetical protein LCGC14_1159740 [marine sediment metagenome]|uniref:Uncharacterized protein n=1 Tax=marine sediment metagenome TaxID=412755 RepID=A0A0F9MG59_9ZZZZ